MNFLAHLVLAGDDEGLRLGAMLGDFIRGRAALEGYAPGVRKGILLHRHIDVVTDSLDGIMGLRTWFPDPFRRYAGIILDLALDHELALLWREHRADPLEAFDVEVRRMLSRHRAIVPASLSRFMAYADRRGLFAAYRDPAEILYSLRGMGKRLSRPNPLHRVEEIWADLRPLVAANFPATFAQIQSEVAVWLKSRSTIAGS